MASYELKVRRYLPESGEGPYWESFQVELDPTLSVLDGILQAKDRDDGSLSVRCSCRAAICGSCGMKINGQSGLACKTQIGDAQADATKMAEAWLGTAVRPERPKPSRPRTASGAAWRVDSEPRPGWSAIGLEQRRPRQ